MVDTIEYTVIQVLSLGYAAKTVSMQDRCAMTLQGRAITLRVQKEGGTFNVR